jgi:hypothetical protein
MLVQTTDIVRKRMAAGKTLDQIKAEGLPEEWKTWDFLIGIHLSEVTAVKFQTDAHDFCITFLKKSLVGETRLLHGSKLG